MPKLLHDQREIFLKNAKKILKEEGYSALSIRHLAKLSGAASGTVYNYFRNKDVLVAAVMLEDWEKSLEDMKREARSADDFPEGICAVCACLSDYVQKNSPMWTQYMNNGGTSDVIAEHHGALRDQINEVVCMLIKRTVNDEEMLSMSALLSETVLTMAIHPELGENTLRCMAARLVRKC